jgi:dimethylargininase
MATRRRRDVFDFAIPQATAADAMIPSLIEVPMFTRAILRTPGPDAALGLTTAHLGHPDLQLLKAQHRAYAQTLTDLGVTVEILPALPGFPDAYFVEDAAVVTPDLAVLTRPGALARRGEEDAMEGPLARHRTLARIQGPGTLDGGDVMIAGKLLFVGLTARTNEAGARQLGELLAPQGFELRMVPVGEGLHLKSSVNLVADGVLLMTAVLADQQAFADFNRWVVEDEDAYATNTLLINGTLLTPMGYPRVRRLLEPLGMPLMELDCSEMRRMDGGLSCLSLRF